MCFHVIIHYVKIYIGHKPKDLFCFIITYSMDYMVWKPDENSIEHIVYVTVYVYAMMQVCVHCT